MTYIKTNDREDQVDLLFFCI